MKIINDASRKVFRPFYCYFHFCFVCFSFYTTNSSSPRWRESRFFVQSWWYWQWVKTGDGDWLCSAVWPENFSEFSCLISFSLRSSSFVSSLISSFSDWTSSLAKLSKELDTLLMGAWKDKEPQMNHSLYISESAYCATITFKMIDYSSYLMQFFFLFIYSHHSSK